MCKFEAVDNGKKKIGEFFTLKDMGWRVGQPFYWKDSPWFGRSVTVRRVA